jgi:hypothetical protein
MSTGCNCLFFESKDNKWYYVLEHYNAPKNSWDWTEHADVVGPFNSEDAADKHLHANNANPGGSCSANYREGSPENKKHDELIARATKPASTRWLTTPQSLFQLRRRLL